MNIQRVLTKMFDLYSGDAKRIQHFTKVYTYASYIGREEGISEKEQAVLEIAAVVHDIGIHMCEEKYGECGGKLQEKEGPAIAKELLGDLDISADIIDRVCFLIGHHHTYNADSIDWQILLEADFLVNGYEDCLSVKSLKAGYDKIFKTEPGKKLFSSMYGKDVINA